MKISSVCASSFTLLPPPQAVTVLIAIATAKSVAAVLFDKLPIKDKKTVCILSGGNIDVNILSRVINRGLLKSGRMSHLTIELLDKPGQLKEVSSIIAEYGANVIRVRHTQGGEGTDINDCYLKISMETKENMLQTVSERQNEVMTEGFVADFALIDSTIIQ